jgi:serralysin
VRSSVNHALAANVENLELTGSALSGFGNGLDNVITGNAQANTLDGGAGADRLIGGDGRDFMTGGAGADTFVAELNSTRVSSKLGSVSVDVITDFQRGVDKIDLSGLDANISLAGVQEFTFGGSARNKDAGDLTFKSYDSVNGAENALGIDLDSVAGKSPYSGPVTVVFGNVDGGDADFAMVLFNTASVSSSDFVFGNGGANFAMLRPNTASVSNTSFMFGYVDGGGDDLGMVRLHSGNVFYSDYLFGHALISCKWARLNGLRPFS